MHTAATRFLTNKNTFFEFTNNHVARQGIAARERCVCVSFNNTRYESQLLHVTHMPIAVIISAERHFGFPASLFLVRVFVVLLRLPVCCACTYLFVIHWLNKTLWSTIITLSAVAKCCWTQMHTLWFKSNYFIVLYIWWIWCLRNFQICSKHCVCALQHANNVNGLSNRLATELTEI